MMKMLNLSAIAKEKKLEYFLYAVAVIIIMGVYFYYNRQITKKKKEITPHSPPIQTHKLELRLLPLEIVQENRTKV